MVSLFSVLLLFCFATYAKPKAVEPTEGTLKPYSQRQCAEEKTSDRPWLSLHKVEATTPETAGKYSLKFLPSQGTHVYLESKNDGMYSTTFELKEVNCENNFLLVHFWAYESHRKILYSTITGKELLGAENLEFSSDRSWVLATTPSDYNSDYESVMIKLYKLSPHEAKLIWEKKDRKFRFDPNNDGKPQFGQAEVKFKLREKIQDITKPVKEGYHPYLKFRVNLIEISCLLKADNDCTENKIKQFEENWSPG